MCGVDITIRSTSQNVPRTRSRTRYVRHRRDDVTYPIFQADERASNEQITNEQLLASIFRPRADPIKGFQSYAPLEEDLAQWHKVRHHLLPANEDRDYTNVEWDVSLTPSTLWAALLLEAEMPYIFQHVRLPFLKDYEIVEQDRRQAGATDQVLVLSFCDGEQMAQQDELAGASSFAGANGSGNDVKPIKIEEEDEDDDDDDIFGDKEMEQEEAAEAKKEEIEDMSTRIKAKGKGVYFVEMYSTVNVKRMRTVVSRLHSNRSDRNLIRHTDRLVL